MIVVNKVNTKQTKTTLRKPKNTLSKQKTVQSSFFVAIIINFLIKMQIASSFIKSEILAHFLIILNLYRLKFLAHL